MICVINESKRFSDTECRSATDAVQTQMRRHVAPMWGRLTPVVRVVDTLASAPPNARIIAIIDTPDEAGALGYHSETPDGRIYGRVFVAPVLDSGGTATHGPNSVSAVLSHEVIEMFLDPRVNLWADAPDGTQWALEGCDAVQEDCYEIAAVTVSNFITPQFFDDSPTPAMRFDFLDKLKAPFTLSQGGYTMIRDTDGTVKQLGARRPRWKVEHEAGRSERRLAA